MHRINYLASIHMSQRLNDAKYRYLFFCSLLKLYIFSILFPKIFCTVEICIEIIQILTVQKHLTSAVISMLH